MRLNTLGGLGLENADSKANSFRRMKPLLLLAYLALEGPKAKRYLAEVFWLGASNAMNSLATALSQLRRIAPGVVENDDTHAWTDITCDANEFLQHLQSSRLDSAISLYNGPFADGFKLELGIELEEWLYDKREDLATRVQDAMLKQAETLASQGQFVDAARHTSEAYRLSSIPEPEALIRYYTLFRAADDPIAQELAEEARHFGTTLELTVDEARGRLQQGFVGREREIQRLSHLAEGEWAGIYGADGMGKTTLLKNLSGTYLPARSGLPYATLEPLIADVITEGEDVMLQKLRRQDGIWLLDDRELADEESQALLNRLRKLRPAANVIISSEESLPFQADVRLELSPILQKDLEEYPEAWEQTGGLPSLVGAFLRGEPLELALEDRLEQLSEQEQTVYLALSLLTQPDPALVRRAFHLSASEMAHIMKTLFDTGLLKPSGDVRAERAAQTYLKTHPAQHGHIALSLARQLSGIDAFPLYQQARVLWEDEDESDIRDAYLMWAKELLRRGFPKRAVEALQEAPSNEDVTFLLGRALERTGAYRDALKTIDSLALSPDVLALRGNLLFRLGQPDAAKEAAEQALTGDVEARAEALNTLGQLARAAGEFDQAESFYRRAAALWRAQGLQSRWAGALNNVATVWGQQGRAREDTEQAFQEALDAAADNRALSARILLNLGRERERYKDTEGAISVYQNAIALADEAGVTATAMRGWNNLGVVFAGINRLDKAQDAYEKALPLARQAGEHLVLATIMANLAELTLDQAAWDEAIFMLAEAGHQAIVEQFQAALAPDHPFREIIRS